MCEFDPSSSCAREVGIIRDRWPAAISPPDPRAFIESTFLEARSLIQAQWLTTGDACDWTRISSYAPAVLGTQVLIQNTLRHYQQAFDNQTAGEVLFYACVTHHNLVPTILELFDNRLRPNYITAAIDACENRYPVVCWIIMAKCVDRLTDHTINKCFNLSCSRRNQAVLSLLLEKHSSQIEMTVKSSPILDLHIDSGILECCKQSDTEMVQLLLKGTKCLAPHILRASTFHGSIAITKLLFAEYKDYLVTEPPSPAIEEAFTNVISRTDLDMLSLFLQEIGPVIPPEAKVTSFITNCLESNIQAAKILLTLCPRDLRFEDGFERESTYADKDLHHDMPGPVVWKLLTKHYGNRLNRTNRRWWIDSL